MDIRNYFNSVPVSSLLHVLKEILADDPFLYSFFERMLTANEAYEHGRLITEERGAMAGTPTSAFLPMCICFLQTIILRKEASPISAIRTIS